MRASGPDSAEFLQGQFTNDLSQLSEGEEVYGLWLDRKGKVVADSHILRMGTDSYLLVSAECSSCSIVDRLDGFIVMDDVDLEDRGSWHAIAVWGQECHDACAAALGIVLPAEGAFSMGSNVVAFWSQRDRSPTLEIVALDESGSGALESLAMRGEALDSDSVFACSVHANRPTPPFDALPTDLPQESSLGERTVSYAKGCYLGQEVMARIKSMGKVRRTAFPVRIRDLDTVVEPRTLIVDREGKKAGETRRLIRDGDGLIGFAMLALSRASDDLFLDVAGERKKVELIDG